MLTPEQRTLRASIAAHTRWSREDPAANAARGQAGLLARVEAAPCGGLHRAELAAMFGLPAYCPSMRAALGIAWQHRKIDFCGQYVVKPPITERKRP